MVFQLLWNQMTLVAERALRAIRALPAVGAVALLKRT
jgi:hypothetical protein